MEEIESSFFDDPYTVYREWSERGTVHQARFPDGRVGWVVTGYEEARSALTDPRLTKSGANARWTGGTGTAGASHMLDTDPPDHTRLRRLVNKAFTARAVERLRARISEITEGLLDGMAGETDLIAAYAVPLPMMVIGEVLGVSGEDGREFRRQTGLLMSGTGNRQDLVDFLGGLVRAKRRQCGDDILSELVRARDEDDRLSERELISMAFLLLFAGHETTVHLIGNGTYALLCDTARLAALRTRPELVPAAIEEFLRYDSPVGWATLRYTTVPVVLGGVRIPAGEFVHVALGAANRDPSRYQAPDRVDLNRDTGGHLAFGHGIHYCVGASLARLEGQIAIAGLLRRFPGLRLAAPTEPLAWREGFRVRGLTRLPVNLGHADTCHSGA